MAIVPITFNDKNVASAIDGGFYKAHNGDGILLGCGMTITATSLIIQSGLIIACGRITHIDGATTIDLSEVMPSSGYLQVVLNVSPLSDPPVTLTFNTSGGVVFQNLIKEDINANPANLYQLELAVIQITGGNLSSLYRSLYNSRVLAYDNGSGRTGMFGFWGSNLHAYAYDEEGNPLAGMRTSDTDNALLFAPNKSVIIRPHGSDSDVGQTVFNTDGMINGGGVVSSVSDVVERQGTTFMIHSYLSTTTACPSNSWTTIRTISNPKFRPPGTVYGLALGFGNQKTMAFVQVTPAGAIQVQPWTSTSGAQSWITYVTWVNQNWTPLED